MAPPGKAKQAPLKCNSDYLKSVPFMLKIFEAVLALVILVIAQFYWGSALIIYISFAGAFGICSALMWLIMFSINVNARFPDFFPIVMVLYHLVMSLVFLAAAICSAMILEVNVYLATMVMSFIVSVLFIADTVLSFLWWRGGDEMPAWPCC